MTDIKIFMAASSVCMMVLFPAFGAPPNHASNPCPTRSPEVPVKVRFTSAQPSYNNLLPRSKIESMAPGKGPGTHSVGLTQSNLHWKIVTRFRLDTSSNRQESCVLLASITLDYGFGPTPVFIDQRYQPGTCPYQATLSHENAHVAILNREGQLMQRSIEQKLHAIAAAIPPTPTRSPQSTQQRLLTKIDQETRPLLSALKTRLEAQHARLDDPRNLKKTQQQCPQW
ncbi:MAG: hypothetical protein HQL77_02510 [Magnetococcales bacterium]|nr:hypothetical protein [Magnetococcales bacterium]MBF0420351.1 hypothetical protein [Magnetococcales bacterium]MBF0434227.1 hypothetical protein [Magnetococcales bacterium]